MKQVCVANFTVRVEVTVLPKEEGKKVRPARSVKVGEAAIHQVAVYNRTTLPYDFRAQCRFPDPKPPRALSFDQTPDDEWTAAWRNVLAFQTVGSYIPLDVHGAASKHQRLHLDGLMFRLANTGFSLTDGGLWQIWGTHPLPVGLQVDVV